MAELLTDDRWPEPDSLGLVLQEMLPGDYVVVEEPVVAGRTLDMVVVAPQGLFNLRQKNWSGQIRPVQDGDWQAQLESGVEGTYPNPAPEASADQGTLAAFLREKFPKLRQLPIHSLVVFSNPAATLAPGSTPDPMVTTPTGVASVILTTHPAPGSPPLPEQARAEIAQALYAQHFSATQRASQPFIFRSGGLVGSGKSVWTIQEAVQHMDRHPEDGIFHLTNGTLAAWLEAEGAIQLADLARDVLRTRESDPRVPLEMFLIGTGLIERPRLKVRPQPLNLGCVISGGACSGRIRLSKGPGRGYLFGTLQSSQPWLRVEPRSFSGGPVDALVTVDTSALPISRASLQADLMIESSASAEPVAVPVRVRISGEPSQLNRYGLRPLVDALAAGLVGAAIGALLGTVGGLGAPAGVAVPAVFWALVIGLAWAAFGLLRGTGQRTAWTATYATARYLLRIALWTVGLGVAAAVGLTLWNLLSGAEGPALVSPSGVRLPLVAMALAILPATVAELRAARRANDAPLGRDGRSLLQPALVALAAIALVALLALGVRWAGPTWQQLVGTGTVDTAEDWAAERWQDMNEAVQKATDQIYLWQYNRPGE